MRILIIEDEPKAAAFVKKGLSESGFIVDVAENGEDGLARVLNLDYDLVILDAMLPYKDGWTVLAEMRQRQRSTRVLFLTARGAVQDRVKGLELGADDYLVKPYEFTELLARVRALLRRRDERRPEVLQIADLRIDLLLSLIHISRVLHDDAHTVSTIVVVKIAQHPNARMLHLDEGRNPLRSAQP